MSLVRRFLAIEERSLPMRDPRAFVVWGALIGLGVGVFARIWMRTISDDPVFTVFGTGLILVVFAGMGACAGLALRWRAFGSARRMRVQRGVAFVPYLLLGPFMLLFLPGFLYALVSTHAGWRRLARWSLLAVAVPGAALLVLAMFENGPMSAAMYAVLALAFHLTNRIAVAPRGAGPRQLALPMGV